MHVALFPAGPRRAGLCALAGAIVTMAEGADSPMTFDVQTFSAQQRDVTDLGLGAYPWEGRVEAILAAGRPAGWAATGLDRSAYLDIAERIVRSAAPWVDAHGAVIDPYLGREWNQSSPRFVSSGAILLRFGRIPELRDTVYRAMTYCCDRLGTPEARSASPDFWMRELVTAYLCLRDQAPADLIERWRTGLARVEPEAIYTYTDPSHQRLREFHNWAVYSSAGESMRAAAGIGASGRFLWGDAFFDTYMEAQAHRFTELGMYRDPADPLTYDITTRLQIAAALAFGYHGRLRDPLEEVLRRGNLTMLQFVSPDGLVPYGGRSSQFNFQEAIVSALCELEARRYKAANPALAGAFKRQAHLGVRAVRPWLLESAPLRHIKNRFPPETRHGCDAYGQYSVYSLLAASFFGLAALAADDTIAEQPAPAECGGYVRELAPAFHKVIASCQGTYVEVDTQADPHYDATGIGRVLFAGLPPALPLGLPFAAHPSYTLAPGTAPVSAPLALGPEWDREGAVQRLAAWSEGLTAAVKPLEQGTDRVAFEAVYRKDGVAVFETCRISRDSVAIACRAETGRGPVRPLRYSVPVLVTDGAATTSVVRTERTLAITLGQAGVAVAWSAGLGADLREEQFANRHGVYRALVLTAPEGRIELAITARRP